MNGRLIIGRTEDGHGLFGRGGGGAVYTACLTCLCTHYTTIQEAGRLGRRPDARGWKAAGGMGAGDA